MTFYVSAVTELIAHVRRHVRGQPHARTGARAGEHPYILVGGYPFLRSPDLWRRVSANRSARDAQEAVAVANQWVDGQAK